MTFRSSVTADGIHNYFWKAAVREASTDGVARIRDRVAIVGMGCTTFGEHWDKGADDLLIESSTGAMASAGVTRDDIDAYWFGTMGSGDSG